MLAYAYLCRRAARRFVRSGLDVRDLEQTAALGLVKAVDRFDPDRGAPFEAFAWVAILGELMHYVRDHEHLVRVPRSLHENLPHFRRGTDRSMQRLGREATDAELAADLGKTVANVRALRRADHATGRRDDAEAARALETTRSRAFAPSESWCDRIDLGEALATLPDRERRVVVGSCVFGLSNVELGDRLALSARHIARLRRRGLARMQSAVGIPA